MKHIARHAAAYDDHNTFLYFVLGVLGCGLAIRRASVGAERALRLTRMDAAADEALTLAALGVVSLAERVVSALERCGEPVAPGSGAVPPFADSPGPDDLTL